MFSSVVWTASNRIEPGFVSAEEETVNRARRPFIHYLNILDTIEHMHSVAQRYVRTYKRMYS
jgi:hypothetical protein